MTNIIKKLATWLYAKYVDRVFIPKDTSVRIYRKAQVHGKDYGKIHTVVLLKGGQEEHLFPAFNDIWESDCGIEYQKNPQE